MDKAVEILKGKHVSRRGRRPRKVAAEETRAESSNSSEISLLEGQSSAAHNGSATAASRERQSTELNPQVKQKRKYIKKSKRDPNGESLPKDGPVDSSNGPDPVIKKRGRGRPRKNVAVSPELLVVQVLPRRSCVSFSCFRFFRSKTSCTRVTS